MDFCDLEVWKKAKVLVIDIYRVSKGFPINERFGLTDQLHRASNSVCANIAEGYSRYHTKDKIKFYYNARGSISECMSHVLIAEELTYLPTDETKRIFRDYETVRKMLNGLIRAISRGGI